jgi:cyclic pyranopterin phosphate synthase
MPVVDTHGRALRALRVSVTDRCNLRCEYCMPEDEYAWLARDSILRFDEIERLADVFIGLGVDKIRLTGGEPLLRRSLPALVRGLASKPGLTDVALTTNGILLADQVEALKEAGLRRVNVSLDTLRADRFHALTRFPQHAEVLAGIVAACAALAGTKIDAVIMRGVNDDELVPLLDFGARVGAEVRFIEYMDVGGATHWRPDLVVSRREMLGRLSNAFGEIAPVSEPDSTAPADRFRLPDGRVFGIISSTTEPFCRTCDRSRLTADGMFYTCLYGTAGVSLRGPLRAGATPDELRGLIEQIWSQRADRAAELRHELRDRKVYLPVRVLRADPHLEMHLRGG